MDWLTAIAQAIAKVAGATEQGLKNQELKIPMQEEALRARAKHRKLLIEGTDIKFIHKQEIKEWFHDFSIDKDKFTLLQEGKVRNMIEHLVKSGKIIFRIDISHDREERCWAYIRYVDDDECETFVKMQGKRG